MIHKLAEVKNSLDASTIEDIESGNIIRNIKGRNKLIKIADRTEGGWSTVEEYETCDNADDSDDDKKIRQANARALQKKPRLQPRRPAMVLPSNIDRPHLFRGQQSNRVAGPLDICFRCGLRGHFRRDCQAHQQQSAPGISSPAAVVPVSTIDRQGSAVLPITQTGSARKAGN